MFGGNFHDFFRGFGGHGHPGGGDDDDDSNDYHNNNHRDGGKEPKEEDPDPNNDLYYKVLGVDKKADTAAIRKAFRQASLKGEYRHPDRGGEADKFKVLNEAYSVLQDPEKRDIYDQYGLKGLKQEQQGGGGGGGFDIFDLLGGRGGGGGRRGPVKAKAKLVPFKCTLEDAYTGKSAKMKHSRKRSCKECDGKGGKNVKKCSTCKGQGMVQRLLQQGPFQQIIQSACPNCKGEGQCMDKADQCKTCKGNKIVDDNTELDIVLEPGVYHDFDLKFSSEGDEAPGVQAGDVYVRVQIEEHKVFKRKGADLYIDKTISLLEALAGFSFEITHLNGAKVTVATAAGDIISHEQVKCVKGKGMPFFKDSFTYGNLYIKFKVAFPERGVLAPEQTEALKKILPAPKTPSRVVKKGEANVEYLQEFHEADLNPNPEGGHKKSGDHDDDEEHGHGGQRTVQCAQQ